MGGAKRKSQLSLRARMPSRFKKIGYVERECTTKNLTAAPHFLATEASSTIGNNLLYTRSRRGMLAKEGEAAVSIMMIK